MAKYIVTGGCGFIGSNLVGELIRKGHQVIVVDNLTTGSINFLYPEADFILGNSGSLLDIVDTSDIDGIFHLGIPSSSPLYREDRALVGKAISEFIGVLEFGLKVNAKVVYASSSSVYNRNPTPWREDMPVYVTDFYSEVRQSIERLAYLYHDFYGSRVVGIRPFSVYGPGEEAKGRFANLVTQAIWSARDKRDFVIYGDGSQTRDFTFVKDMVAAFILAMDSSIACGVFNAGTGTSYSLNAAVSILESLSLKVKIEYTANPIKNYVQDTLADTSNAEQLIGFKAKYCLAEGLRELLSQYSSVKDY